MKRNALDAEKATDMVKHVAEVTKGQVLVPDIHCVRVLRAAKCPSFVSCHKGVSAKLDLENHVLL